MAIMVDHPTKVGQWSLRERQDRRIAYLYHFE
jgi:hypothetical protein